jgi:bifunctional oligoribonuclease and PAP phosphatase NrnA
MTFQDKLGDVSVVSPDWDPTPRRIDDLQAVARHIQSGDDWLIVTHERPDGDAIGSSLAMAHILQGLGKKWKFVVEGPMPPRFAYLTLFDAAVFMEDAPKTKYKNVIAVDCADMARFETVGQRYIVDGAQIVNVDHHQTNPRYGVASLVDPLAAATCELIYHLAKTLDVPLSTDLATCLYTGILTDTGGFAQPNTTREIHQIAAALLASGVQPYDIAEPALESRSWSQMRLVQMALNNLTVSADGKYAILYVTQGMLEGAGCNDDDAEGLVGFARCIDTVEVGALFREVSGGRVKVSLRSKRVVDVARIAQSFHGGGHTRAAGCMLTGDLSEVIDAVIEQVEKALSEV